MTVTQQAIASAALRYKGKGYVYGGDCSGGPGDWDCSSFVSYVLGHDLKMRLPGGGKFGDPGEPPNAHGPVVLDYAQWPGATTVSQPSRGDLVCWPGSGPDGHIGIVLGPNQMISALNPQLGTLVSPIDGSGPAGVPHIFRQVTGKAGQLPPPAVASAHLPGLAGSAAGALLLTVGLVGGAAVLIVVAWPVITGVVGFGIASGVKHARQS